ncbi:hypothetical protein V6N13_068307 [Hibiscus sabdariffa]|uniref:Uncharacterized protein n=1 Tax=Hibiscus sabdariffa TaxID=183260 RepID=A0ABR2QM81_9ROSI
MSLRPSEKTEVRKNMYKATVDAELQSLAAMVAGVWSDDKNVQLEATIQFRDLLSVVNSSPNKETIQSGVVPRFVEFLARDDFQQLQAVWALRNVAGDLPISRDVVLGHGALMPLLAQFNEHAKLSML